jgi:putative selenium metabolism hydrolase
MTIQQLHEQTVALCSRLIQARSYSGEESEVAKVVSDAMRALGYDEITVDVYGNVIGCLKGKRPGARVLLDGHIDTVQVQEPERWSFDPFGGKITEDRVCGRGASDMKGAVAAMICAAACYADACGRDFPGEIYVAGVVYEELYEGVSARKISEFVRPDYVIIGEASDLNLKIGQRGRAEIVLETVGKPAHSANPEKGVNAVKKMMKLLAALEDYVPGEQEGLGKGILELTDIISTPYPGASVVPERCTATLDRRLLVGETKQSVLAPIQARIDALAAQDSSFQATVRLRAETKTCYTGNEIYAERFFPAWLFHKEDAFIRNAYESLQTLGTRPILTNYSFCTNGSHYAGEKGIRTIGFGPSLESLAHTVDEYVSIDQLEKSAEGYLKLLDALLVRTGK